MRSLTALMLAWAAPALCQAPVPEELKTLLAHTRTHSREHMGTRGATLEFARIKSCSGSGSNPD